MNLPRNRWLAFASHFGLSFLIFLILLLIILFLWYPGALFAAAGGWQGVRIVIGVDLIIGPLLTLIVYNFNKPVKLLILDLSIIAFIQLTCLTAGVFIVYRERPVAVTYAYNTFHVLKHSDFIASGKNPEPLNLNYMTPKIFYTSFEKLSKDTGVDSENIARLYNLAGQDLVSRVDLYKIFPTNRNKTESILAGNQKKPLEQEGGCFVVKIESAYAKGTACFYPERGRFRDFQK